MAQRNKAKMPWSVKGVTHASRDLAKSAAADHEATMGEWLSHVIRRVGAAEASGRPLAPAANLVPQGQSAGQALVPTGTGRGEMPAAEMPAGEMAEGETIEDAALVAGVHARLERSEARLLDVLDGLEEVVERLADRITRLERRVDRSD